MRKIYRISHPTQLSGWQLRLNAARHVEGPAILRLGDVIEELTSSRSPHGDPPRFIVRRGGI